MTMARAISVGFVMVFLFSVSTTGSFAAPKKPVVAVRGIQLSAQNISCERWRSNCMRSLARGFRAMLETAIIKTRKMEVMEREQAGSVVHEQGLGQVGLTTRGGKVGGLTGVDYNVYGTITKFGSKKTGFHIQGGTGVTSLIPGMGSMALGSLGSKEVETEMAVDIKITDVSTGKIVIAETVDASVKQGSAFTVGGIKQASASADPFADVQRVVAARIAEALVTARIPIKVIAIQKDGTLILNYGNVFFAPGDRLIVFAVGEVFVDPDTGEKLGAEETELGVVEVTRSQAKFSRAKIVGEPFEVKKGSTLKRAAVAEKTGEQPKKSGANW